jgi:hypothetical protein
MASRTQDTSSNLDLVPKGTKERDLHEVHEEALVQFGYIQSALRDERMQCLQDRRFVNIAGAQWEGPLGEQFEHKPKLEVNKTAKSVDGIIREYRNNRMDVRFVSKDGAIDDNLADTCAKLYRSDEQDSSAEDAKDNAFQESVDGGIGAWRLRTRYENEESEEEDEPQRIVFEPIVDADSSVFFDLDCKRQDKSDARYCYVVTSMTYDEYEAEYDESPANWPKQIQQRYFDWLTPDVVYVAEYYIVEWEPGRILFYRGLDGSEVSHTDEELENDEDLARTLKATGFRKTREKKVRRKRIHKYVLSGGAVLEDCGCIVGSEIPIVITYGKRVFIDNVERVQGHVRGAKDSQRILNMQVSNLAELSVMSPVEKPIVTPEQIAGHQEMWAEDNIVNRPYLVLNAVMDAAGQQALSGPLGYTKAPQVPPAQAALIQFSNDNIKDIMGNPDEAGKVISHVTGQMVQAAQQVIDSNAFIYISNMAKAIRRCGQIWLSMARQLYTQKGRKMKGIGDVESSMTQIELQKPIIGPDGKVTKANDLTRAFFDVTVEVGPSSESKRQAATQIIAGALPVIQDPTTQGVLALYYLSQIEGEGVAALREYARMELLKKGVGTPTPEEVQKMAQQAQQQAAKPSPTDQFALASAAKAQADAQRAVADQALIAARTEKTKVDSVVALAGVDNDKRKAALDEVKTLSDIHLDHKQSAMDTAESLHGMLTQPSQDSPPGAGQ